MNEKFWTGFAAALLCVVALVIAVMLGNATKQETAADDCTKFGKTRLAGQVYSCKKD